MKIETVKDLELVYLVNGTTSVPKDISNRDFRNVQAWITAGGIVEKEDLLLKSKNSKIVEIISQRDINLSKPTPQTIGLYSGNIANKSFDINVKDHLGLISGIIVKLQRIIDAGEIVNPTRNWTDATGEALELDINDFTSLFNHLDDRDAQEHSFCAKRVAEVESLTTLEEVEAFDITKIYE